MEFTMAGVNSNFRLPGAQWFYLRTHASTWDGLKLQQESGDSCGKSMGTSSWKRTLQ